MKEHSDDSDSDSPRAWRSSSNNSKEISFVKTGPLSEDEQRLVLSLQSKFGNKWKKIAAHLPGRTPKRLSKWFDSFQEQQPQQQQQHQKKKRKYSPRVPLAATEPDDNRYDQILETIAEKYVQQRQQQISHYSSSSGMFSLPLSFTLPPAPAPAPLSLSIPLPTPSSSVVSSLPEFSNLPVAIPCLPPWMYKPPAPRVPETQMNSSSSLSKSSPSSPSVTLSLSPSPSAQAASSRVPENLLEKAEMSQSHSQSVEMKPAVPAQHDFGAPEKAKTSVPSAGFEETSAAFLQECRELEERQQSWFAHKKETSWRLKRLQQQLEAEKARKRKEKMEEIESKVKALREEEKIYLERLETDYREQLLRIQRDADVKEARMMELWTSKHLQISRLLEQLLRRH